MAMCGHTRGGSDMARKGKKRIRVPVHITLDPLVLDVLDYVAKNRSQFIEEAVIMRLSHEKLVPRDVIENLAGRTGFEPATTGLKARCSNQAELPALAYP